MSLDSGHTVKIVSKEEKEKLDKDFPTVKEIDFIRLDPDGWFFYDTFLKHANDIYNFKLRPTDVLLMTIPKSGTSWTQNVIWNMRHDPDLVQELNPLRIMLRSPQIDLDYVFDSPSGKTSKQIFSADAAVKQLGIDAEGPLFLQIANKMKGIRTLKTHLPFSLIPKNTLDICKVVYVVRNPKDVCVSYYHHCKLLHLHDYKGSFDDFVDYFKSDSVCYLPYWPHIKEALAREGHPNLHIIYFEDLKKDTKAEVLRLNDFLGTNLTEAQMDKIIEYTSFANTKKKQNESFNDEGGKLKAVFNEQVFKEEGGIARKGIVGDSTSKFSKEQEEKFNKWIEENTRDLDIRYKESH